MLILRYNREQALTNIKESEEFKTALYPYLKSIFRNLSTYSKIDALLALDPLSQKRQYPYEQEAINVLNDKLNLYIDDTVLYDYKEKITEPYLIIKADSVVESNLPDITDEITNLTISSYLNTVVEAAKSAVDEGIEPRA